MNEQDRKLLDELNNKMGGIDERTRNTYHLAEKIELALTALNGTLDEHGESLATHNEAIGNLEKSQSRQWKILGGFMTLIAIGMSIFTKVRGLW